MPKAYLYSDSFLLEDDCNTFFTNDDQLPLLSSPSPAKEIRFIKSKKILF